MTDRYLANKGKDRKTINARLNRTLERNLKLRPLITVDCHGALNRLQVNGTEVRALFADLTSGDSLLLAAVCDTYAALSRERATLRRREGEDPRGLLLLV